MIKGSLLLPAGLCGDGLNFIVYVHVKSFKAAHVASLRHTWIRCQQGGPSGSTCSHSEHRVKIWDFIFLNPIKGVKVGEKLCSGGFVTESAGVKYFHMARHLSLKRV